ncbi:MAG: HEAT repeat domain-containing protein [Pirellulales bacterium]
MKLPRLWTISALAMVVCCQCGAVAHGANQDREFQAAKRKFTQRINAKRPDVRIETVEALSAEPSVENARLLLEAAFSSKHDDVRQAAAHTLEKFKDDPAVCEHLLTLVESSLAPPKPAKSGKSKGTKGKQSEVAFTDVAGPVLLTLLSSEADGVSDRALALLEKAAGESSDGETLIGLLADALGERGGANDVAVLANLAAWKAVENSFPAQRAVTQALIGIREKKAIDALVAILQSADGQVKADIVQYLALISGQPPAAQANIWAQWWEGVQESFEFPGPMNLAGMPAPPAPGAPHYYGVPLYANRMVFVLDTSGSMKGDRIVAAVQKLNQAIDSLHPKVEFTVVVFHAQVGVWQRKLVPATSENRLAAQAFISQQQLGPATASYNALEAALNFPAESIYFLTDGAPHGGKTDNPVEIVNVITRLNKVRRMSINAFGIGVGPAGNVFDSFLRALSEKNYGVYRRVDQVELP